MSLLKRIEKQLDARMRGIFGSDEPGAREAIELYRDAIDQVSTRVTPGKRGLRIFPFNRIKIELTARDPEQKAALEALFEKKQITDDIRAALKQERAEPPADLTVSLTFAEEAGRPELHVDCTRVEKPTSAEVWAARPEPVEVQLRPARLTTLTGVASTPEFALTLPLLNLGREGQVIDPEGRLLRHNELVFPEDAHEANATVSRRHAHIQFEPSSRDWRIYDDGSSVGTSLFRAGRRLDVPPHGRRGVALRHGDEIHLGQVRLRFEIND